MLTVEAVEYGKYEVSHGLYLLLPSSTFIVQYIPDKKYYKWQYICNLALSIINSNPKQASYRPLVLFIAITEKKPFFGS